MMKEYKTPQIDTVNCDTVTLLSGSELDLELDMGEDD